jgi:hypothetical protein
MAMSSLVVLVSFATAVVASSPRPPEPPPPPHITATPMTTATIGGKPYKASGAVAIYKETTDAAVNYRVVFTDTHKQAWMSEPVVVQSGDCGAGSCTDQRVTSVTIQKAKDGLVWIRFVVKSDHYQTANEPGTRPHHEIRTQEQILGCRLGVPDKGSPTPACALVEGEWKGKATIKGTTVAGKYVVDL